MNMKILMECEEFTDTVPSSPSCYICPCLLQCGTRGDAGALLLNTPASCMQFCTQLISL
jgi:hypothetical protein